MEAIIELPEGIQASIQGNKVVLKSQKGEASREFKALSIELSLEGNKIRISSKKDSKKEKKIINSIEAHLHNLVAGLQKEYSYKLAVVYSHFPINVSKKENKIEIVNFLGSKKPKQASIVGKAQVEIKGKEIIVHGVSKEQVGQTAANIEQLTRLKGKDRRIFQDGIFITSKSA